MKVNKALSPLPGVASIDSVNVKTKKIVLTVDPGQFDVVQAFRALAKEGYRNCSVQPDQE